MAIGARVRQERVAREWTLDDLSNAAGVSRRMLVNVEQGTVNPSVGTLLKLSDALGVGLPALVEPPRQEELHIVRNGDGATLWTSALGGRGVLLAGTSPPDVVELWDWVFQPGDQRSSEAHARGTRELLHVQEGVIEIVIGDQSAMLSAGDAASFLADVDHTYANHGDVPARFTLAVFEPGVGTFSRFDGGDHPGSSGERS
jgi:transcriptional regulator with XRE-family HTH domain